MRQSVAFCIVAGCAAALGASLITAHGQAPQPGPASAAPPSAAASAGSGQLTVEWPMWGGSNSRNNTPVGHNIPTDWDAGEVDLRTGDWNGAHARNIKWVAKLGSQTYGNVSIAGGKAFIGSNNGAGWLKRFPAAVDISVMLCFDIANGRFLWQHSSEKLPTGRIHDWEMLGTCSTPLIEGDRLWFVTNRGEVRCLDVQGFYDNQNDGPFVDEEKIARAQIEAVNKAQAAAGKPVTPLPLDIKQEADIVWVYDMMKELHISQHNISNCSVLAVGDLLFVSTSNGVDLDHKYIPAPEAPCFICLNKITGELVWADNSVGGNVQHGQWSSPAYAVIKGVPQVLFGGGDGWLYSFDPKGENGKPKLLWKFDANPKTAKLELMGEGDRNDIIGTPVIYNDLVYIATGQDVEHGDGVGNLYCLDPTKRGDVSAELAFNAADPKKPIPHKRVQAVVPEQGDFVRPNPNSAVVWHYNKADANGDGEIDEYTEEIRRSLNTVAIRDDILYIADFRGVFHCLDAKTGKSYWTYDMMAQVWGSPTIVEDKVYIGDYDGEVSIFRHSKDPNEAMKEEDGEMVPYYGVRTLDSSVVSTPVVANNVLYISTFTQLYAIAEGAKVAQTSAQPTIPFTQK